MPSVLRSVAVGVFLLGILVSLGDLVAPSPENSALRIDMIPVQGRPDVYQLESLQGLTPRSGSVRVGDLLQLVDPTPATRLLVASPGVPVPFVNLRTHSRVTLADTLARKRALSAWKFVRVAIEITALVLLILRGAMVPAVGLSVFLFLSQFTAAAMAGAFLGESWQVFYRVAQSPLGATAQLGLIVLAAGVAPASRRQRIAAGFLLGVTVAWGLTDVVVNGRVLVGGSYVQSFQFDRVLEVAVTLGVLGFFVLGITRSHGTQRRRLVVLALAVAVGNSSDLYGFFGPSYYNAIQATVGTIALILMTVGLAYAILVDHMFDFELVINRAVVFALVSAIVVPIFILIEWLVGREAERIGQAQGVTIEMGLAVLIGLSLRPLHQRVDAVVDRVFFAARHRNANAVMRFAEECYDIESRERLLEHAVTTVRRFGRVQGCAIALANEHGDLQECAAADLHVPPLDRDDLVTLRLRNTRRPLKRQTGSPLDITGLADAAFPIPGRKRLEGVLLCSLAPRAEPFSHEEFTALARLAHELGAALAAIDAAEAHHLREEIEALRAAAAHPKQSRPAKRSPARERRQSTKAEAG